MQIEVDEKVNLILFSLDMCRTFFEAIHREETTGDSLRLKMQKKYPLLENLQARLVDAVENKYEKTGSPDFFIFVEGQLAGVFEFHPFEKTDDDIEIGYWLFPEFRGKGVMLAVLEKMKIFAQHNFSANSLVAWTASDNEPSKCLLVKAGFTETGDEVIESSVTSKKYVLFLGK